MLGDQVGTQFVVFKLGKEEYGFEVSVVREIHTMDVVAKVHRSADYIEGVTNLRGKLLTVINLRKRFGMEPKPGGEGSSKVIVVDSPTAPVGFMVDEVLEVARIEKGSIEEAPSYIVKGIESEYVTGIAKIDERLITLIDPLMVLQLESEPEKAQGGDTSV